MVALSEVGCAGVRRAILKRSCLSMRERFDGLSNRALLHAFAIPKKQ
jgi:hypothetical protein